jgi:hypothetical protein
LNINEPQTTNDQEKTNEQNEEMSNFVFLYKTYYNFVSSLLFRQQSPQIGKVQADMKFSLVDDIIAIYVKKEK